MRRVPCRSRVGGPQQVLNTEHHLRSAHLEHTLRDEVINQRGDESSRATMLEREHNVREGRLRLPLLAPPPAGLQLERALDLKVS